MDPTYCQYVHLTRRCPKLSVLLGLALLGAFLTPVLLLAQPTTPSAPTAGGTDDQVMAWVGNQPIFASEIMGKVDQLMEEHRKEIPPDRWHEQRVVLAQQALKATVENKLVLVDALRKIPAAGQVEIQKKVDEQFEEDQVKKLMTSMKVESRADLEKKLLADGSSLEQQRRTFFERSLSYQWARSAAKVEGEVSHNDMVAYYEDHLKDYERPARARWEQLSVNFDQYPDKQAAYAALAKMGNDVLNGVPWAEVARAASQGSTAREGGTWDWTTRASLASKALDQALFSLPVGTPSPILEDERAFHIVRVVEREDAGRTPFRDAQVKIKEEIEKQRRDAAMQEYYAKLRKETRVWSVFDDPVNTQRFAESLKSGTRR